MRLQHVSIAIPPGCRGEARAFYGGLLGLREREVPPKLDPSSLVWFHVGDDLELHLMETGEPPPRGPHFCLVVDEDLAALRARLDAAGVETADTTEIVGRPRFMCRDPFGNRIELARFES